MNAYICRKCGQASYSSAPPDLHCNSVCPYCRRRRQNNRTKTKIARAVCGLSGLSVLLIVGGVENFWMPLGRGALWLAISIAVFALSAMKGGLFR